MELTKNWVSSHRYLHFNIRKAVPQRAAFFCCLPSAVYPGADRFRVNTAACFPIKTNFKALIFFRFMRLRILLLFIPVLFLFSCKRNAGNKGDVSRGTDTSQSYFPLARFVTGQMHLYNGQPISLYRIEKKGEQRDTAIVNSLTMDWALIIRAFRGADISDPKFVGRYNVSFFEEDVTGNRTLVYEAREPELFTRQLQVTIDPLTGNVVSIYVETAENGTWRSTSQHLLYKANKLIQIQQDDNPMFGKRKKIHVDYRFL